ncbi:glycosyltransferase [Clavibacter michiganensis]|uniref:glycosyltransferase n=1 Tax=Clavibacter michiganensis TaxID=28447 RepID=UPI0013658AF7|nr:glycosyltransferase [Clavibacter michiganensis]MDO4017064.1 glycosyltransferase [Clavibacter michiganensis]MDO4037320.1 glycosyltransferase [Clavibacter michiganensis]MDO4049849.1 glycosyltransferase [Clavibacter michiganensis]MDO4061943.1 glycosyltransferase [Clavibacter michiganensis]MDO4083422.1 glycosyltransferase [Clavibacter michiganensis]
MRIAMISEHASPLATLGGVDAGGQNVHVAALSAALAEEGHTVTVYTRRDDAALPARVAFAPGVEVVHLDAGPARAVPKDELLPHMGELADGLLADWRTARPDVVHSHFWMSGVAALDAAARLASSPVGAAAAPPVLHTFHALGSVKRRHLGAEDTSPAARAELEPGVGRRADAVIATCSDEAAELVRAGVDAARITVIPCGVDIGHFTPREYDDAADADPTHRMRVMVVGRLVPRKGVDLAIEAVGILARRGRRDVELVIVGGSGDAADAGEDAEARRLMDAARAAGVADRVRLHGRVSQADMPAVMRTADVVVCAPWYEPFGIVPLEAMASGVPVVASAVGGLTDSVVDGVTGILVPPRDPAAIADALEGLLADPARRRRLGRAGRDRMEHGYAWSTVAARTAEAYRAAIQAAAPDDLPADPTVVDAHLDALAPVLADLRTHAPRLTKWGREMADRMSHGARLLAAGNGGSAAEAQHLTSELVGRFDGDRRPFSAIALHSESSAVTAIGNDYGFDEVFARQVHAHARSGDIVVLLSTSGRSQNLLRAAAAARAAGATTWAMTGPGPNPLVEACDEHIALDGPSANVQEAQLVAVHAICRSFESRLQANDRAAARASAAPAPVSGAASASVPVTVAPASTTAEPAEVPA